MTTSSSTEQPSAASAIDGCPHINGTLYTSPVAVDGEIRAIKLQRETAGQSFLQFCSTNLVPDNNTQEVEEIAYLRTRSFEDCMDVSEMQGRVDLETS
ncbi:hypothetical protein PG991_011750 [Apiospora marii]|uniref:Uncharacterized protein n=1 Tax=Apiospora marii TaxID=335849 RepID=A0ABR1RG31_9PEZI